VAEKEEAEPISEVIKTESIDALEAEIVEAEEEIEEPVIEEEVLPVILFDESEEVVEVLVVEKPDETAPTEEPSNKDLLKVESETLSVALNPDKSVIQAEAEK